MKSVLLAVAGMLLASSCNTTAGFGRDLSKLGSGIESSAARHE